MRKKLFLLLFIILFSGCSVKISNEEKKNDILKYRSIFDFEDYREIKLDTIESISLIRYTVGGESVKELTNKEEIEKMYNSLKELKIGEETARSCEDNTTVYRFNLSNGKTISIEIECNWFIINRKHYNIVN